MTRRKTGSRKAGPPTAGRDRRLHLDLQVKSRASHVPSHRDFTRWIKHALAGQVDSAAPVDAARVELTLRIVGPTEMRTLNHEYRGKDYATNVLSFPLDMPPGVALPVRVLGDIVLCAQTVQREAREQGKDTAAHWAHLTVHGVLHLLGMDHMRKRDAARMESVEIAVLHQLGIADPYQPRPEEP